MAIPLYSHCYTSKYFCPKGAIFRECWYISWAGSTKYMSRRKYQIRKKPIIRYLAFSNPSPVITWNTNPNQKVKHNTRTMYLKAIWWATNQVYWTNFDHFLLVSLISTVMLKYKFPPPPVAQQRLLDQGLLIIEASRSHSDTLHWVGLLWTSDQPDEETSKRQYTTLTTVIHARGGILICNPSRRSAADQRLRPRGHWDRLLKCTAFLMQCNGWRASIAAKFMLYYFINSKLSFHLYFVYLQHHRTRFLRMWPF